MHCDGRKDRVRRVGKVLFAMVFFGGGEPTESFPLKHNVWPGRNDICILTVLVMPAVLSSHA